MIALIALIVGAICWLMAFACARYGFYDVCAWSVTFSLLNLGLFTHRFVSKHPK